MPDLSTLPATSPARAGPAFPDKIATAAPNDPPSAFLGQLKQSLAGPDVGIADGGTGTPEIVDPAKPDAKLANLQLAGQPSLTNPIGSIAPPAPNGKAVPSPQVPVADKKLNSADQASSLVRAHEADRSTPTPATPTLATPTPATPTPATPTVATPTPPAPTTTVSLSAPNAPQQALNADHDPDVAAGAPTPGKPIAKAILGKSQPKSNPLPLADPVSASALGKPQADTDAQAAVVATPLPAGAAPPQSAAHQTAHPPSNTDPLATDRQSASNSASPQSSSPELRRAKLTTAETAEPNPTTVPEPASSPTTPAAASSTTPASHLAAPTIVQPGTSPAVQTSQPQAPLPPAIQVAQAVADPVRVVLATPPQESGGPHVTTIELDPVELGRVEIRIERTSDGPAKVELAAERPETLLRLIHDQPQLQQALDQAGIPQQGRTITFSLASDNAAASASFANFSGDGNANGNGQRSPPGHNNPHAAAADITETLVSTPAWSRTGLDITA